MQTYIFTNPLPLYLPKTAYCLQNVTAMGSRTDATLIRTFTNEPDTVAIVWIAQLIGTDQIAKDAVKIIISARIITVSLVIVTQLDHAAYSVMPKASVSVNLELPAINVIVVKSTITILDRMAARIAAVPRRALTITSPVVILTRERAIAKRMWRANDAENVNRASSIWTLTISLVVHRVSVMVIRRNVYPPPVTQNSQ